MTEHVIKVALIDDDHDYYLIIKDLLQQIPYNKYVLDWFPNSSTGLQALKSHQHDIYLVDYRLDSKTGLDLLDEIQHQEIKRSIILLTGQGDYKVDVEAMSKGASDFLNKDELNSENLERSIRYCLKRALDQEKIKEAQKIKAEKESLEASTQAKTIFLAHVSHEIRAPLGIIMGFTDLALDPNISSEERNEFLSTIKRNSAHLLELINDLLDLSKVESGQFQVAREWFNWRELIADIIITMKSKVHSEVHINHETTAGIPHLLKSDAHRVRQILINLISNSIKFTEKGSISIYTHVENINGSLKFIIDVSDTGIGLTEEEQDKLFKPFQQAHSSQSQKYGGTGLGLDLSRKLARALGGDLYILSSLKNIGSTFRLVLPQDVKTEYAESLSHIENESLSTIH